jgi:F-type H+-transporting ATPase subunit b
MRKQTLWSTVALLISAGVALASEGAGGAHDLERPEVLFWKGLNIAIVVGALVYFFKEPFLKWIEEYKNQIIASIKEAEENHAKAKEELMKAKKALEEAKVKYEESIKVAEETAEREKQAIISQAEEIAKRIEEKAEKVIEIEINKAKEELRRYAAQKAIELSEKMLKELFADKTVQEKFVRKMLSDLSKN